MKTIMQVRHTAAIGLLNSENPPSRLRVLQAGTYVYTEEPTGRLVYDIMGRPMPTTAKQILRIETLTGVTGWLFLMNYWNSHHSNSWQ